MIGNGTRP